jgi:chromosome segregation ATPase
MRGIPHSERLNMNEPESSDAPLSAHRQRIADLIGQRDGMQKNIAELDAAIERLGEAQAAVAPIEAELFAFDAESTKAMDEWSRSGGDMPKADAHKRDKIARRLAEARAQADAATRAKESQYQERNRLAIEQARVNAIIAAPIADVLADEYVKALIDDHSTAKAALAKQEMKIGEALAAIGRCRDGLPQNSRDQAVASAAFDIARSWAEGAGLVFNTAVLWAQGDPTGRSARLSPRSTAIRPQHWNPNEQIRILRRPAKGRRRATYRCRLRLD